MDLIGAIDLLDGGAVRLFQGDYARVTTSVADPEATVRGWVRAGLRNLHIVDLDGARAGRPGRTRRGDEPRGRGSRGGRRTCE